MVYLLLVRFTVLILTTSSQWLDQGASVAGMLISPNMRTENNSGWRKSEPWERRSLRCWKMSDGRSYSITAGISRKACWTATARRFRISGSLSNSSMKAMLRRSSRSWDALWLRLILPSTLETWRNSENHKHFLGACCLGRKTSLGKAGQYVCFSGYGSGYLTVNCLNIWTVHSWNWPAICCDLFVPCVSLCLNY